MLTKLMGTYSSWDSVTWITFISNMVSAGNALPIREDIIDTIKEQPYSQSTITAIMENDKYTIRLLRRLSGIFLVRVYISDKLTGGYINPITTFTLIGETWQVAMVKSILTTIDTAYKGFTKNKEFVKTLKVDKMDMDGETIRRNLTKAMVHVLDRWPSFRPKNVNHPHKKTPVRNIRKYQKYELNLFMWMVKKYKFEYDRPNYDPGNWEEMPIQAPWHYISDLRNNSKGYKSLLTLEVVRKNNMIWPGKV